MRVAQPLKETNKKNDERKDAHDALLRGHISDQHAPPGIVSAPHTCLNAILASNVFRSLFLSRQKTPLCMSASQPATGSICSRRSLRFTSSAVLPRRREKMSDLETWKVREGGGRVYLIQSEGICWKTLITRPPFELETLFFQVAIDAEINNGYRKTSFYKNRQEGKRIVTSNCDLCVAPCD